MSQFDAHVKKGYIAHLFGALLLVPALFLDVPNSLIVGVVGIALPITLFMSVLPDIDHPSSHAYNLFRFLLFGAAVVIVSSILANYTLTIGLLWLSITSSIPFGVVLATVGLSAVLSGAVLVTIFEFIRPAHRGPTHSVPFGLAVSILFGGIAWTLHPIIVPDSFQLFTGCAIAGFSFLGFMSHLREDDIAMKLRQYSRTYQSLSYKMSRLRRKFPF